MKKRICMILAVVFLFTFAVSASAGVETQWRSVYTPYSSNYKLTETLWAFSATRWNADSIAWYNRGGARPYFEYEMRPAGGVLVSAYWDGYGSLSTNLPNAYAEVDTNDFSIGCNDARNLRAEVAYYGNLSLFRRDPAGLYPIPASFRYVQESETGDWYGSDGWPNYYEFINIGRSIGVNYNWNSPETNPLPSITSFNRSGEADLQKNIERIVIGEQSPEKSAAILSEQVSSDSSTQNTALITFDDYLSPEYVSNNFDNIEVAYFWVPGETGRTIAKVEKNDVLAAVEREVTFLKENSTSRELLRLADEYERGNVGVFAIRVSGTASELFTASQIDDVLSVELHDVGTRAETVHFVEIPQKPDHILGVY